MVHLTDTDSRSAEIVTPASEFDYPISDIVKCMRTSAYMLQIADDARPQLNILNRKQAELLNAAADDLEKRGAV